MNDHDGENERLRKENERLLGMVEAYEKMFERVYGARTEARKVGNAGERNLVEELTAKQHCALQCVLGGASNVQMAERMGVTESTAKTYVRGLMKRFNVRTRSQLALAAKPMFDRIDAERYLALAGVPKDWFEHPERDDEVQGAYYGARK